MKINKTLTVMACMAASLSASALAPGDQVTCTYSDGFSWSNAASEQWTVNDMVEHCLSGGGTATVTRPRLTIAPG